MSLAKYLVNNVMLDKIEFIYKNYRLLPFQRALGCRDISNDVAFRAFSSGVQPGSQCSYVKRQKTINNNETDKLKQAWLWNS